MLEELALSNWMPIIGIACIFAVAGTFLAVISVRSGQYRDPEEAKYTVLGDDEHPEPDHT